jgi:signal transduction histidine kinase
VFRLIQEALNNIEKHSKASQVTIELRVEGQLVRATISDNGLGFDPLSDRRKNQNGNGTGLVGMLERTRFLGGSLHIKSGKGAGTEIAATLPLNSKEGEAGLELKVNPSGNSRASRR